MTNFEKYKDKILEIVRETNARHPAIKDGVPMHCRNMPYCEGCDLKNTKSCYVGFLEWLCEDNEEQELTCNSCKHAGKNPCSQCSRNYMDMFELKPEKTRQSEFLKLFPNATVIEGTLKILPCGIEGIAFENQNCNIHRLCTDCRKEYWLKEVE